MSDALKKITISIPAQLFELGLTESQVHGLSNRWFVISLFQQGKITATQAGALLSSDHDGFLNMLDSLGILYQAAAGGDNHPPRVSPPLAEAAHLQHQVDTLTEELAQTRYELFEVKQQLRQADQARTEFIATISHELRTPLNSIIGFAKLLLKQQVGPLNNLQQTDLSLIYDSAKYLLGLVNNILDFSKIEAGKIRLDMAWVSIEEITVGVIPSTYILIQDKPISLNEEIEAGLPQIYVDRERIRQVIINLLSNAAKFTDSGSITLRVYRLTEKGQEYVCFSVSDTGIGISKDDIDTVFEPFRQIDNSTTRRAEGTGLGVPISFRLVKLHGGRMWVESKIGQGSTFSFTVPVSPPGNLNKTSSVKLDYR